MKKPIALLLISIMVLMLSAFSFAGNGNSMNDNNKSRVNAFILDEELFITLWLDAEIGDVLEEISVEIDGDGVWHDDIDPGYVFGSKVYKFPVIQVNEIPDEDFEITVFADFSTGYDQELTKKVDLEDLDEEDDDEEDEDDEEDMDDDMYPAAPAIANKLLKDAGIPNRVDGVNLIAAVSAAMTEDEEFGGFEKDDDEYAGEVEEFLIELLEDHFDESYTDLDDFADEMDTTIEKQEVKKINVEITDVDKKDKEDKEDKEVKVKDFEDDGDDDDDDDDEDDDDDDDEEEEEEDDDDDEEDEE